MGVSITSTGDKLRHPYRVNTFEFISVGSACPIYAYGFSAGESPNGGINKPVCADQIGIRSISKRFIFIVNGYLGIGTGLIDIQEDLRSVLLRFAVSNAGKGYGKRSCNNKRESKGKLQIPCTKCVKILDGINAK